MTTDPVLCRKCLHPTYNHENADGSVGKCRYWGCRCRSFSVLRGQLRRAQSDPSHSSTAENAALDENSGRKRR